MPFTDPEKQREYRRAYHQRRKNDPVYRGYRKKSKQTAEQRAAENKRHRERYKTEPEFRNRKKYIDLKSKIGVTKEQIELALEAQKGLCAGCGLPPLGRGKGNVLVPDHDHKTGKFRGMLCGKCNCAVGMADDSPQTLLMLAMYLI